MYYFSGHLGETIEIFNVSHSWFLFPIGWCIILRRKRSLDHWIHLHIAYQIKTMQTTAFEIRLSPSIIFYQLVGGILDSQCLSFISSCSCEIQAELWRLTYAGKTCHSEQSHAKVMHPTSSYKEQRKWVFAGRIRIIQSHELHNVCTMLKTDRMIKWQHAFKKSLCCLCILVRLWCKLCLTASVTRLHGMVDL